MTRGRRAWGVPATARTTLVALPLIVFVVAGLLAPVLAPADPTANDLAGSLLPPSADHLLGTDQLGRDQLSRILYGARISLAVAAAVLAISLAAGVVVGTVAGYLGGPIDRVISRVIDMAVSLPGMLVALAIIGVRGPGVENLVIAMPLWTWAPYARMARARVAGLRGGPHLDALRLLGAGPARVIGRHLLPPALAPCLVYASTDVGTIVLGVATLSFLGLGIPPPHAEWGQMLIEGRPYLASAWWLAYPPGVAITAVVFASNLLGERLAGGDERPSILRWVLPALRPRRPIAARTAPAGSSATLTAPAAATDAAPAAATDGDAVIRARDLSVCYPHGGGRRRVVAGVSYEVRRGRVLAIVGESGSGKTTAALAPFGLLDPDAVVTGSVTLGAGAGARELVGLPPHERRRVNGRRVGVVFQDSLAALNPLRTVGAHVDEAVGNAGRGGRRAVTRRVTEELLRLAGLPDPAAIAREMPHRLSGGMRQRVQIAIALAGEPEVLVADEPTSALDVTVQARLLDLLGRLRDELAMAMVLVSHDLAVVSRLADSVAVMYAGRVVESGPLATVIENPDHPYTRGLLDAVPRPGAAPGTRFRTMPGRSAAGPDDTGGCAFAPRCPIAVAACAHDRPALEALASAAHRSACSRHPGGTALLPVTARERDGL
ncbi:dipeptide/oligopeptide/nickel ABC transporter ATP-binding protein [Sphaerisporangium siamense]|uniref:Oligopeptide/dipeptide ABC transporter ATP-binding protein n=1 Tax=Sphaerisporangium siamense TaxID=795645 RepID=A0A7W7DB70_9ACTN|nr:dipeptide/oligopeptide/nickel ABC transporter permease/ATP-binding protein [Sphaerisporangium siamense]MBB4702785.1 oligopeptide/dipeptide ABC transporter ATP-binding protein [Sphaerisporangium siamense]GII83461.1 dipeptide/oligopeptide/nickel ABC transporter ATP-binding protein [Sphaerisporangium siamense]